MVKKYKNTDRQKYVHPRADVRGTSVLLRIPQRIKSLSLGKHMATTSRLSWIGLILS